MMAKTPQTPLRSTVSTLLSPRAPEVTVSMVIRFMSNRMICGSSSPGSASMMSMLCTQVLLVKDTRAQVLSSSTRTTLKSSSSFWPGAPDSPPAPMPGPPKSSLGVPRSSSPGPGLAES